MTADSPNHDVPSPPRAPRISVVLAFLIVAAAMLLVGIAWGGPIKRAVQSVFAGAPDAADDDLWYTCGMHPWIIEADPGLCDVCHMDLTPIDPNKFAGEIAIDPVVTQSIGVRIAPVTTGPLVRTIRTVGTIEYDETALRDVNVKVAGWIEKLHVDYIGAPIERGDPLFDLYSPELYVAQESYLRALEDVNGLDSSSPRELRNRSQDMLDSAETQLRFFDISEQQIADLAARGEPTKTVTIHTPHRGVVIAKHANEGMRVDPGMQVYRIADLTSVWVIVTLYEYQLPFVQEGQRAVMTLPYIPGQTFEGEVLYIYPYLDETTRQVHVRLELENPHGLLKPGMYADIELKNTLARDRTLAPREAMIDTGTRQVAFVSLGEGRFEPRDVRTGVEMDDGMIEILDGLRPGEMVVTSGTFLLDSEANIREGLAKMITGDLAGDQEPVVAFAQPEQRTSLDAEVSEALDSFLREYFTLGESLASDSMADLPDASRQANAALVAMSGSMTVADGDAMHEALSSLEQADDMAEARAVYGTLSEHLAHVLAEIGVPERLDRKVQKLVCPMATVWFQPTGSLLNPYMGEASGMIDCHDPAQTEILVTARESTSATEQTVENQ